MFDFISIDRSGAGGGGGTDPAHFTREIYQVQYVKQNSGTWQS